MSKLATHTPASATLSRDLDGEIKWWRDSVSFVVGIRSVPGCDLMT